MPTHVALLRAINLGARNRVAMAALRELVASLGHADVGTYLQSGNVLFTPAAGDVDALATGIEQAMAQGLGVEARVVIRAGRQLASLVRESPFTDEVDPRRVHVVFLDRGPHDGLEQAVAEAGKRASAKGSRDAAALRPGEILVHTPDGFGRSVLVAELSRGASRSPMAQGTARNWSTVTALAARCDG